MEARKPSDSLHHTPTVSLTTEHFAAEGVTDCPADKALDKSPVTSQHEPLVLLFVSMRF